MLTLRFDVIKLCLEHEALRDKSRQDATSFARRWNEHIRIVYFALSLIFEWGVDPAADELARYVLAPHASNNSTSTAHWGFLHPTARWRWPSRA